MTTTAQPNPPNRLIHETSPYLLQHAHNPVDWYPWGPEALGRARAEDKPILLSVGYSACHWCHVMAHESFEDPATAAEMNAGFVNIKVDREERPDLDAIYMDAVQSLTGRGGWPMTVFLTPDGRPFYGGTYYPPAPRYGMPSFRQVLGAISDAWRNRRRELESAGDRLTEALNRQPLLQGAGAGQGDLERVLATAARNLMRSLDPTEGGFGDAPKFPQPMNLDFLLRYALRTGDTLQLKAATYSLTKMAHGGIYDQLGGGFHRYSTDALWLVPHFEKMLYDNAQLARTYLHAWQVTGDGEFRRVVEETLDYVLREMTAPEGAFYSTQDADSEGVEGKFFLWTPAEVRAVLGEGDDARLFCAYFDVTARGNFHEAGRPANILHVVQDPEDSAAALGVTQERLAEVLARGRAALFAARQGRIHPGRDDKALIEWNGLMLHAFAEAGAVLGRGDYLAAAERAAEFVLGRMSAPVPNPQSPIPSPQSPLRLYRTYNAGRAHLHAYLEDYAALGVGLLGLYEATFDRRWLTAAVGMAEAILADFGDPAGSAGPGFFQTGADHEALIARRKDFMDNAVPAGNSLAAELLLRLARLLDRPQYVAPAEGILGLLSEAMAEQPLAFGRLLCALDLHLHGGPEIALVGQPAAADTQALLTEVRKRYLPGSVLALAAPGDADAAAQIPLLVGRDALGGCATAYVCRDYVCNLPVTDPAVLAAQLVRG